MDQRWFSDDDVTRPRAQRVGGVSQHNAARCPSVVSRAAAFVLVLFCASQVSAHPAPFSYLDIVFRNGGNIEGSLMMHVIDIAHELNVTPTERVLDPSS